MSHIHIPDGIIGSVWWITGYLIALGIIYFVLRKVEGEEIRRKVPMIGIVTAIMIIGMSVPLGIVPVHLTLAVLSGILIGPGFAFISVFVVNLMLALVAHGGITLVGLNTLIVGTEVLIGYYLFKTLSKKLGQMPSTVIATSIALIISMTMMVTMVGSLAGLRNAMPDFHLHSHEEQLIEEGHEEAIENDESPAAGAKYIFFTGWAAVIMVFVVGNLLESFGTAYIIRFFMKVRPDLIYEKKPKELDENLKIDQ
ncbi:energy-coupling factor ABC transporter permease [Alkaliphilus transvaalensis]|uniref:energy-coupling factor ABC transporter permease n=1 Tax=Alkaliphilus transvaalensis TaxID=114628 RepID=UPI00047C4DB1|nr:energy-coupling factor ABC transporter permease [Alkaliphilus transvaalensis]